MRLADSESDVNHLGAHAQITTIWLEDSQGVGRRAALVHAFPDVWDYGFVPGRNAVYAVTATGVYLAPYTIKER